MEIKFIAGMFLFSVAGYYLYENLNTNSSNISSDNDEEE